MKKNHPGNRALFICAALLFMTGIFLLTALPGRKPPRSILPALTRFDRFFLQNELYLSGILNPKEETQDTLYRYFCLKPFVGGRYLEMILDAAWNEYAFAYPFTEIFIRESGALDFYEDGFEWAHDPDTAYTCLASPQALSSRWDQAQEIKNRSRENWSRFPEELQDHLATLLGRSTPAASAFRKIRHSLDPKKGLSRIPSPQKIRTSEPFIEEDLMACFTDAEEAARELDLFSAWLNLLYYSEGLDKVIREMTSFSLEMGMDPIPRSEGLPEGILYAGKTPYGVILVGGPGDTLYPAEDLFLVMDLGGNDTYDFDQCLVPGAKGGSPCSCSTVIDLQGDDHYKGGAGKVAGAILGYRTIIDLQGNDRYLSGSCGLGAGFLGMGLLADLQGNDLYEAKSFAMGAGVFGLGLLFDDKGDDRYRSTGLSHGFAGPCGLGVLVEGTGDDWYQCLPSLKEDEWEGPLGIGFAQGCYAAPPGIRLRGIALLLDMLGDDTFQSGSMSQGAALGKGFALLLDARGFDSYEARNRCQGFGSSGGIALLRDMEGKDLYKARTMAQGMGESHSIGFLIDDTGDDRYSAFNGSQGKSRSQGIGRLFDKNGRNRFSSETPNQ